MARVELHYGAATDVGVVRTVNEDACLAAPPIFVVADGMGGHDGGDVASSIVAQEFAALASAGDSGFEGDSAFDEQSGAEAIRERLRACQRRILEYAAANRAGGAVRWYSGTTAVAALLISGADGPAWLIANLGDSRAYRLDDDQLIQVSVDHSVVQELIDAGRLDPAQAATHPERHVITRALGGPDEVEPDFFVLPAAQAGRILLCSDGVTGMIDDAEMARILSDCGDPRDAAEQLVEAAVRAGGRDNATAVVVDVVGWADTDAYDAQRQRVSLEEKLGTLP